MTKDGHWKKENQLINTTIRRILFVVDNGLINRLLNTKVQRKLSFWLTIVNDLIGPIYRSADTQRQDIIEKHAMIDEKTGQPIVLRDYGDGRKQYQWKDAKVFQAEMDTLLDQEIPISHYRMEVKLSSLPKMIEPVFLTPLYYFAEVVDDLPDDDVENSKEVEMDGSI